MSHISHISFPGLGIPEFSLNNVAFTLFGFEIMWYAILITCGMILAFCYAAYRGRKNEDISFDNMLDYAIYCIITGVIGARLYYVFTSFDEFKGDTFGETLKNILNIRSGGLAIYGGIIGGIAAIVVVSLIKKIQITKILDAAAPAVMIGQILGRFGNFFNGEAYGWSKGIEKLPWRMYLEGAHYVDSDGFTRLAEFVHPTFLYESLWNLLGFILLNLLYRRKKFDGQIFLGYITWYGFGRMFIEGLRTDSLYIGSFRISQLLGFLCFIGGSIALVACSLAAKKRLHSVSDSIEVCAVISEDQNGEEASENADLSDKTSSEDNPGDNKEQSAENQESAPAQTPDREDGSGE